MSLPNKKGMTRILRECYASIGIKFPNDPEDKKLLAFSIETAVEQIDQSSGTTWNAALEAFAGLIQLRCMKWRPANPGPSDKGCVVDGLTILGSLTRRTEKARMPILWNSCEATPLNFEYETLLAPCPFRPAVPPGS